MSNAKIKIRNLTTGGAWSPDADGGFDCANGDVLEVQLEDLPSLDVTELVVSVVVGSKSAAALAFPGGGPGPYAPSPPSAAFQITAAERGAHSWLIRSQANGGAPIVAADGSKDYSQNTRERILSIRTPFAHLRKGIVAERGQYSSTGGWMDAQNEEVDAVDAALASAVSGITFRELVLHRAQLDSPGGILPGMLLYFASNPSVGNTLSFSDGTTTETWTFVVLRAAPFEVTIGATAADTMDNLGMALGDSSTWGGDGVTGLDRYFAALPPFVAFIERPSGWTGLDRVYGTLTTPTAIKVRRFSPAEGNDYGLEGSTEENLPAVDPGVGTFGFGRVTANLHQNETHLVANDNSLWTWDADDQVWRQIDIGGLVRAAPVNVGTANAQGSGEGAARPDHVHRTALPTKQGKGFLSMTTTGNYQRAAIPPGTAIALGAYIAVSINGVFYEVGDGNRAKDCYFSGDAGATAKAFGSIDTTVDELYWNGALAGFDLNNDRVDYYFEAFPT